MCTTVLTIAFFTRIATVYIGLQDGTARLLIPEYVPVTASYGAANSRGFAANIAWGGSGKWTSGQPLVSVPDPPKTSNISL